MNDMAKVLAACGLIVVFVVAGSLLLDRAGCAARWEDSGRRYDWSAMASCRVEDKNGRLMPEKTIRNVQ